jgi:CARDB protein
MKKLGVFLVLVVLVQMTCAVYNITGWAEDALDGENVDGKDVLLWNPTVGISDNVSDVVGTSGNSGVSKAYLIDCDLLAGGCNTNDILSLKIFWGQYISWVVNVTVSGSSPDSPGNLSLNSPPSVNLTSPVNSGFAPGSADFNCSFSDHDDNVDRVALWGNWSGAWIEEGYVTSGFGNGYIIFNENIVQGSYKWNCFVEDDLGIGSFNSSNNSFFVDTTLPVVYGVVGESAEVCGFGNVAVNCSVYDSEGGVGSVIIQTTSPENDLTNYSASWISGDVYGASVSVDSIGDWGIECFANDSVGNLNSSSGEDMVVFSGNAELGIVGDVVGFDLIPSVENEVVNVSVNVSNSGCIASGIFTVGFFDNDGNFKNETVSVGSFEFLNVSALWFTKIGLSNISVHLDLLEEIGEDNESNNVANNSIYLKAWQDIYGNMSLDKILGGEDKNMSFWGGEESFAGNIFVADSESDVEWDNLQAIGRTKAGLVSSNDFSEIDSILEMGSYNDSIYETFSVSELDNFSVFQRDIANVSYVNSSANGNFVTGILWDMGDSSDSEYDSGEGEDVVFVAKVNRGKVGSYGVYDYEISIPSKLRSYDVADESSVYLYYDLN